MEFSILHISFVIIINDVFYSGHFLLTHLLLNKLKASKQARIVNNTALAYKLGQIDFDDINYECKEYKAAEAYSQSKLALVFFTQRLAKELEGEYITITVEIALSSH